MQPKIKKVAKKPAVKRAVAPINVTGELLRQACNSADSRRLTTGLSASNPNSLGILNQNHPGGYTVGDGKNAKVFTPKGGNNIVNLPEVLDALKETAKGNSEFIARQFKDGQVLPTRATVLVASSELTHAVASTRKSPAAYEAMITAIGNYLDSQYGKPAAAAPKAAKVPANVLPTKLA